GPCYADKAARLGIRVQDMLDEKILKKKIMAALEPKRLSLRPFARDPRLNLQTMSDEYLTFGHRLEQFIADTATLAHRALDDHRVVLFEGAQGALLDIDHGTYPFVTSSNPVAGAACVGGGGGARDIDEGWGGARLRGVRATGHRGVLGRREGVHDARRRGAVPDGAARRDRRRDPRARRRARHDDRAPAADRVARPRRAEVRGTAELHDVARRHEARRARRLRPHQGVHALPRRGGGDVRRLPLPPVGAA